VLKKLVCQRVNKHENTGAGVYWNGADVPG
jgi:hypothetical protein